MSAVRPGPADVDLLAHLRGRGGGEVSLTAVDKYTYRGSSWATTVCALTDSGDLDRDRVLDAALARDFSAFRAGWYSRLWVLLAPDVDEVTRRQAALRSLLHSDVKPTVTLAVRELARSASALDPDPTARALSAAAMSPVKGTAVAALALLRTLHRAGADVVPAASAALLHPHADVQRAAALLLHELGAGDVVEGARELLDPSVAVQVTSSGPNPRWHAESPVPVDLAAPLVATEGVELTDRLAGLLEDPDDVPGLEMVLAGLAVTRDSHALEPLRARAAKVVRSTPREGTTTAWVRGRVARLILRGLGDDVAALPVSWDNKTTNLTLPIRFLVGRLGEIADIPRGRRPPRALLAAPQHAAGWIAPDAFVGRLLAADHDVQTFDLVAAFLRLHPEGRAPALDRWTAAADRVVPELDAVVRHALGAPPAAAQVQHAAWWVAAGRCRAATEVDPLLIELGLTGAGRALPLDLRVTTTARSVTGQSTRDEIRGVHQTWVERSWSLTVADAVPRLLPSEPTGFRQEGARGWHTDAVREYVGWSATIWPADAEHFLAPLAGAVLDAAVSTAIQHDASRVLTTLGDHPGRLGPLARATLAAGLSAARPTDRVHAVDAVARLAETGRLAPTDLAAGVVTLGEAATLTRMASSWRDLASTSPHASAFVVDTLAAALPRGTPDAPGMHAVVAVLENELLRAGRPAPPPLLPWLRGLTGGSTAARTGARIAAR